MIRSIVTAATLALLTLPLFTLPLAAQEIEQRAVNDFILPVYHQFSAKTETQISAMSALCEKPGTQRLEKARQGFSGLVSAWGKAEIIRFGPILEDNRLERILFWPDRKSIGLKQIQRAIAQRDESVLTLDRLQQKSVALQGLGALEFILFGTGSKTLQSAEGDFRCHYGLSIAKALHATAEELTVAWEKPAGFAQILFSPSPDNPVYRDQNETLRALLGVVAHGPELILDTRLKKYLGETEKNAKPKSALFWRSNLTFKSITANLKGLRDFAKAANFNSQIDENQHWVANSYMFEAQNGVRAANIETPVLNAAIGPARKKLQYLTIVLASMGDIAREDLSQALGQTTGFSSLDGD